MDRTGHAGDTGATCPVPAGRPCPHVHGHGQLAGHCQRSRNIGRIHRQQPGHTGHQLYLAPHLPAQALHQTRQPFLACSGGGVFRQGFSVRR